MHTKTDCLLATEMGVILTDVARGSTGKRVGILKTIS